MYIGKTAVWGWRLVAIFMFVLTALGVFPALSTAQGLLETPQPGSFQSGIGLVRGWVCQANRVEIEIVGRGTLPAVYGELRGDTQSACNGKANNGFSLLVNWNELGEGTQTVRALADGVEIGRAQVTVATLGQPFFLGAQGEFIVQPFPGSGNQTRIRWEEKKQAFTLADGGTPATGGSSSQATAKLEDPSPGSFQSGIGVARGWVCQANRVDIEVIGRGTLPAVYGELRGDTQSACGGKANNGFSLQINWNEVGPGTHTLRALADGVEFGRATFTVATLGLGAFPTGLVGNFTVADFPKLGAKTQVQWQESQQNFVITGSRFAGISAELCTTRNGQANDGSGGNADVTVTNPCLLSGNTAVLRMKPKNLASLLDASSDRDARAAANGAFFVCGSLLTIQQGGKTFDASNFQLIDFTGKEVCGDIPAGSLLDFFLQIDAQSELNLNAPFTVLYNGQPVVDFPVIIPPGSPKLSVPTDELAFFVPTQSAISEASGDERAASAPSQEQSFQLTNIGQGRLEGGMTLIASDSGRQSFELVSDEEINLGPGQSQVVVIRFTPLSTTEEEGSLRISTNGGGKTIRLTGGVQTGKPVIAVSTLSLELGTILVGTTSTKSFTVTNVGTGILTGSVETDPTSPFSVVGGETLNLAPGESQAVTILFAPTEVGRFDSSAILQTNVGDFVVLLGGDATDGSEPPPVCSRDDFCCLFPDKCKR